MLKATLSLFLLGISLSSGFLIKDDGFMMYFQSVNVTMRIPGEKNLPDSVAFDSNTTKVTYNIEAGEANSKLISLSFAMVPIHPVVTDFSLKITVKPTINQYWIVSQINGTVKGKVANVPHSIEDGQFFSTIPAEAPEDKSFHCGRFGPMYPGFNQATSNCTPVIEFFGLQMQAELRAGKTLNGTFADPWDCVGFFTIGIWSGIFVTIFLLIIITWGLAMIMNVKTMDRFDDPKGKQVSFGGTE